MKATPAQNKLKSVKYQTTAAIITAGKKNSRTLTTTMIITNPMMRSTMSIKRSAKNGKPRDGKSAIRRASYKVIVSYVDHI